MKIGVLSDLHLELTNWIPPHGERDVIVLAGDIHTRGRGPSWAREQFPDTALLYVAGNHEYYGENLEKHRTELRELCAHARIHFLDRNEIVLNGVRFLGCTLWTDYALDADSPVQVALNMRAAEDGMNDHRRIRTGVQYRRFRPEHARHPHDGDVQWLRERLSDSFDAGPTVVVTHHLPHPQSVAERFRRDSLTPAFASDLSPLVRSPVSLWIHGHSHDSSDYQLNGTRVVCNPRGYVLRGGRAENPNFDPTLTVEV